MASLSSQCDPDRLALLLGGQLPEGGQAEAAAHLEACHACRSKLESLAAGASWWDEARQLLRAEPGEPQSTVVLACSGKSTAEARKLQRPADEGPPLHFLTPSDDPTKLGRLGPYEIVELIGHGGMGIVLRAFDAALNRYVAIKVLAPQLASSAAARRRFAREAQAAAAVSHEHVIAIHAVLSAGGFPYLVMPLITGQSLQERIDQSGPLEVPEILRIGAQVASGLAAAHAQGLVHRDIKPANILLENGVERVMITDFGLARAVDDASLTASGLVAGTPQYMSPEQATGETIDHRTDLFSLASVMYAMCTGQSPFRAETTMAVLRRICEERPRPIRDINRKIPEWLAEIIEKLHEKDPTHRFQTAAEVAELLGQYLAYLQQPRSVPRPPRVKRRRGRTRVRRRATWLAVASLVLVVGGLGLTELTGVTHVFHPAAGVAVQGPQPHAQSQASLPNASSRVVAISVSPQAKVRQGQPAFTPDVGYQQRLADLARGLDDLHDNWRRSHGVQQSAAAPAALAARLGQLEGELRQQGLGPSPESLAGLTAELKELEQQWRTRRDDSWPISPAAIAARLEQLERELREYWP